MPKKAVLIILLIAIIPMFFLLNFNDLKNLVTLSSFIPTQELNLQELGDNRLRYYSEPREVIKFAALGAWKNWDNRNIRLKDTIDFTVSKINSQKKNKDKKIEIIWYDTEGSAKKSDVLVNEIIAQEDIFGIIGPHQSAIVSTIKNKVAAANLLHITMTQGDIDLIVPRAKSYFSSNASVFSEAKAVAKWNAQNYEEETPFIIMHEGDLYSKKYSSALLRNFHKNNLNMLGSLNYERKNSSGHVQRYITESLKFAPDLNIISIGNSAMFLDFYKSNTNFIQKIKNSDFIINQDAITWEELQLLPNIDKSYIILNYKLDDSLVATMKELYYEGGIKTTLYIIPIIYRTIFMLSNALEQAESNDINTVLNYMNTQTLSTPLGDIAFSEDGYVKNYPINIVRARELYDFLKKVDIGIVD